METMINGRKYRTIKEDLKPYFAGLYGGDQHLSTKGLSRYGCGSVTLNTYAVYKDRARHTKEELTEKQDAMFRKYLLGPTSALRFKLAAILYYGLRGQKAKVKIIHGLIESGDGLKKMMRDIVRNIDNDNPVPFIMGMRVQKGYKDHLDNHWVTITGYSDDYMVLVSNNGRLEELSLRDLARKRLFIASVAITLE